MPIIAPQQAAGEMKSMKPLQRFEARHGEGRREAGRYLVGPPRLP